MEAERLRQHQVMEELKKQEAQRQAQIAQEEADQELEAKKAQLRMLTE